MNAYISLVDYTLLRPEATEKDIQQLCAEAMKFGTKTVCVNSLWVNTVSKLLTSSSVETCAVVGFPLGSVASEVLTAEISFALKAGADEIDMVLPLGLFRTDPGSTLTYLHRARAAANNITLKLILETAALSNDEIHKACLMASQIGFDFVKTSTGFSTLGGATPEAVALMRASVPNAMGVKASGGIRNLYDINGMVEAGASRLGLSSITPLIGGAASTDSY